MSTDGNLLLKSALWYERQGFSVIPVRKNKRPYIKWEGYQKTRASKAVIIHWFKCWPEMNIGLVTGKISGFCVIDVDTKEGEKALEQYLPQGFITPVANTPKGGRHLYCLPSSKEIGNNAKAIEGVDFRGEGGYVLAPPSVGGQGDYTWCASAKIGVVPLAPLPQSYIDRVTSGNVDNKQPLSLQSDGDMFTMGRRDNDLFHVANAMVKGGSPPQVIQQTLKALCASWGESDECWIGDKIGSALKRAEKRERNLSEELKEWVDVTTGNFLVTEVYTALQLNSRAEKRNATTILSRLKDKGIIERYGNKNGAFRKVDTGCQVINWRDYDEEEVEIEFPLGVSELVKIMPGNIVVVAGASNAGKTAFLLRTVFLNMERHNIYYFSSEMGGMELASRLSKFNCGKNDWNFNAYERVADFADVIRPDDINIIDFLEVHEDFWKVGGLMKAIHDKLKKGIALIAIQKNASQGREIKLHGLGGERSIEKARLYLAMDDGIIRVVKGKNWRDMGNNPNGLKKEFKLMEGCKFIETTQWKREI